MKNRYDVFSEWLLDLEFYLGKRPADVESDNPNEYVVKEGEDVVAYWDRTQKFGYISKNE
jgi:hypothetical protein